MYEATYRMVLADTSEQIRESERLAFDHSVILLRRAQKAGPESRESVDALLFLTRLWTILLEDLSDGGNGLPDSLKAGLISIGIWMLRRAEEIRQGKSEDFSALIEVSETIRDGLGKQQNVHSP